MQCSDHWCLIPTALVKKTLQIKVFYLELPRTIQIKGFYLELPCWSTNIYTLLWFHKCLALLKKYSSATSTGWIQRQEIETHGEIFLWNTVLFLLWSAKGDETMHICATREMELFSVTICATIIIWQNLIMFWKLNHKSTYFLPHLSSIL